MMGVAARRSVGEVAAAAREIVIPALVVVTALAGVAFPLACTTGSSIGLSGADSTVAGDPDDSGSDAGFTGGEVAPGDGPVNIAVLIGERNPAYTHREFIDGLVTEFVFDLEQMRIGEGHHLLTRVRSRQYFSSPALSVDGTTEPVLLGTGTILGGFEWRYVLPNLPAGRFGARFFGSPADPVPVAQTTVFVFSTEPNLWLTNASFEDGTDDPPEGWTRWYDPAAGSEPSFGYETMGADNPVSHGKQSVRFWSHYAVHGAGLWQRVGLGAGWSDCTAHFSVAVRTWDKQESDDTLDDCGWGSFQVRAGIDPTGGTDMGGAGMVWVDSWEACPDFVRLHVRAPVAGEQVTVAVESLPKWGVIDNFSWWDEARLEVECD